MCRIAMASAITHASPISSWNISAASHCSTNSMPRRCRHAEVAAIGAKIATALVDLHRQNVIHLDIKPSNIMMRESGEAAFIDFGLSRHLLLPDLLEAEFQVPMGTGPYISPEQLLAQPRRSALRYFLPRRAALPLRHQSAAVRLSAGATPAQTPPVARSGAAAQAQAGHSTVAAGGDPALPRGRPRRTLSDRSPARLRPAISG